MFSLRKMSPLAVKAVEDFKDRSSCSLRVTFLCLCSLPFRKLTKCVRPLPWECYGNNCNPPPLTLCGSWLPNFQVYWFLLLDWNRKKQIGRWRRRWENGSWEGVNRFIWLTGDLLRACLWTCVPLKTFLSMCAWSGVGRRRNNALVVVFISFPWETPPSPPLATPVCCKLSVFRQGHCDREREGRGIGLQTHLWHTYAFVLLLPYCLHSLHKEFNATRSLNVLLSVCLSKRHPKLVDEFGQNFVFCWRKRDSIQLINQYLWKISSS